MLRSRPVPTDGWRRSLALLKAFQVEQTDPGRFYTLLAEDSVGLLAPFTSVAGRTVLDVGAGRPEFAEVFGRHGASYVATDPDLEALGSLAGPAADSAGSAVAAAGEALPLRDAAVDVCFCSNVFEHVRRPDLLGAELVRVTRPGGFLLVGYTNWLSPWGGHETSPWHYLGGARAIRRYTRHYGHEPKNQVGHNLFKVSVADGLRWARSQPGVDLLAARPRYYPAWAAPLVRVPGVREVATWNLLLVLRRA